MENPVIRITMEDESVIRVELYPKVAPITVMNFVDLVDRKFYNGLTFHRVIKGFMIQGGCPEGTGVGGSVNNIKGEFKSNGVQNNIKHERGVLSMARSQNPNSASSQFFIMHEDSPHLNGNYAAFGKVIEGMEVVDKIADVKTGPSDKPVEPVVIKTMEEEK
ncbi:MAG: peptidylprolyl isomerase [Epulopiscium sp. Nuni2H_MBin003]|nr:MAG: peptidylprolyl isomerase [Epulopiscium sp. Nuni2H_MBin003]